MHHSKHLLRHKARVQYACKKKISKIRNKKMLIACGANEKERIARSIHKLKVVVHAVVVPVGLLDAKAGPGKRQIETFHGPMEGGKSRAGGTYVQ